VRTLIALFFIGLLAVGGWLAWGLLQPVSRTGQKFVLLRPGYSTRRIATELKSAGIIENSRAFLLWHYLHPSQSLKAGEYLFERPANSVEVYKRLVSGDIYVHTVVIPEGYTIFDVSKAMEAAGLGTSDSFLKIFQTDTSLISDLAPEAQSLEGYLFPNTYEFTRTQTPLEMVTAMVKQFRSVAQQIGLNADVNKTVTMASIIEKETGAPEERPLVASVYYNRLNKNVALDADPTIIYGELLNNSYQGALHHADMQIDSPYNTYRHAGLPPGPIGNPGKSSLEAAMHPASTNYLYFVSNGNGHHRFAGTLEEHNQNVAAYRKALAGR